MAASAHIHEDTYRSDMNLSWRKLTGNKTDATDMGWKSTLATGWLVKSTQQSMTTSASLARKLASQIIKVFWKSGPGSYVCHSTAWQANLPRAPLYFLSTWLLTISFLWTVTLLLCWFSTRISGLLSYRRLVKGSRVTCIKGMKRSCLTESQIPIKSCILALDFGEWAMPKPHNGWDHAFKLSGQAGYQFVN